MAQQGLCAEDDFCYMHCRLEPICDTTSHGLKFRSDRSGTQDGETL